MLFAVTASSAVIHAGQARAASAGVIAPRRRRAWTGRLQGDRMRGLPRATCWKAWSGRHWPVTSSSRRGETSRCPELVSKIQKTMPQTEPGQLDTTAGGRSRRAHPAGRKVSGGAGRAARRRRDALKQVVLAPAAAAPAAALTPVASHAVPPPSANLAQLMRGYLLPELEHHLQRAGPRPRREDGDSVTEPSATSNFSWADWGAGIYSPWKWWTLQGSRSQTPRRCCWRPDAAARTAARCRSSATTGTSSHWS